MSAGWRQRGLRLGMLLVAVGCSLPTGAGAAEPAPAGGRMADGWTVIVSPYAWAASLVGDGALAGFETDVDIPFSDVFRHLDFVMMGNVEATNGRWGVYVDGQYVRTSQDEDVLDHEIGLEITTTTLSAGAFFTAYERDLGGDTVFGEARTWSVEPTAGLRWTKLKATVEGLGTHTRKSADWIDPFIGLRTNLDLDERWNVFAETDVGGFGLGSDLSVNAQAYLGYRTFLFDQPTIIRAGYRVLYQDYDTDDFTGTSKFEWDVTQHGPVIGLSVLF